MQMMNGSWGRRGAAALILMMGAMTAASASAQGDWAGRHGDSGRTGRAQGVGQITRPAVSWQISIGSEAPGARVLVEDVTGDGELEYLSMVDGAVVARSFDDVLLWDTPPLGVTGFVQVADMDGDDRPEILLIGQLLVVLDGETGQVVFRRVPDNPTTLTFRAPTAVAVNNDADPELELFFATGDKLVELYDFSQGFDAPPQWVNTDAALPGPVMRPVIGDFDGDPSRLEAAIVNQSFCQIVFIDMNTGATLRVTASLTAGLFCYGLTQAVNVDSDPQQELIFTGNIGASRGSVGINVYDFVDNAAQWQYEYANNNNNLSTLTPAGAVADIDGDGQAEVFTAVYNNGAESGAANDGLTFANQWSVAIYDAASGDTLGGLENRSIVGLADVDHDGVVDLITRSATLGSLALPATGTIEIWTLDGGRAPSLRFQVDGVGPVLQTLPVSPAVTSRDYNAIPGLFDLNSDGRPKLLVARGGNGEVTTVQALSFAQGAATVDAEVQIEGGNGVTLIQAGAGLLDDGPHAVLRSTLGRLRVYNRQLTAVDTLQLAGSVSAILAVKLRQGAAMQAVYRAADGAIVAIDPTNANPLRAPTQLWSRPANSGDFISFDADGDGLYEVVFGGTGENGVPYVEMLDSQGQVRWRKNVDTARFAPFALVYGQFGGQGSAIDVAALTFLQDNTAITWTFDGVDGEIISSHVALPSEVNANPNRDLFVTGDRNGDQIDDLLLLHFTTFERLSGANLSRIGTVAAYPRNNANPINTSMVALDGRLDVYVKPFSSQLFAMDVGAGSVLWTQGLTTSTNSYAANFSGFADVNGDGRMEIAVPGFLGDLTLHDGATGAVVWRMCLVSGAVRALDAPATLDTCQPIAPVSAVATADIDGDGGEEFVVGDAEGWLYALNVEDGSVSWSADLTSRSRFPALADFNGDGLLDIAFTNARSELVLVVHAEITAPDAVREVALDDQLQVVEPAVDLDRTTRLGALGAAWDAAPRADSYLVSLLTSNNTVVVNRVNVGNVTEHVFSGIALVPGTTYKVSVVAVSDSLGAAPETFSNGILAVGGPPRVIGLGADPNPLTLSIGQTTRISALASASGVTLLTSARLRILDAQSAVVVERNFAPGLSNFNVIFNWDGTDGASQPVAVGEYTVEVVATDDLGLSGSDQISLTVREPGDPIIDLFEAAPLSFNPAAGQSTILSASVRADNSLELTEVAIRITDRDDNLVFEEVTALDAASFRTRTIWDGTDLGGELVDAGQYDAQLSATDALDNRTSATLTLTVIPPDAPTISGFIAEPDTFDPAAGQTTRLTASINATGAIAAASLTIRGLDNATVFEQIFAPDVSTFSLQAVWDGRDRGVLVAPGQYSAELLATDIFGNTTQGLLTITVVEPGAPVISGFTAEPDTFDPAAGQTTQLTASINASGAIEAASLTIRASDDTLVFEQIFAPNASTFNLQAVWDGQNLGALVSPGQYSAELIATDVFGNTIADSLTITVVEPGAPVISGFTAEPDTFDPAAGQTTRLTASINAAGAIESTSLTIRGPDNAAVFVQDFTPNASTFSLQVIWDGRDRGVLVAPGQYSAELIATDVFGDTAEDSLTITVVAPGAITIEDFSAAPDAFEVGKGETTLTASINAGNGGSIDDIELTITAPDGGVAFQRAFSPDAGSFALELTWDGRDISGAAVEPGDYDVLLTASNTFLATASANLLLTILPTSVEPEPEGEPEGEPEIPDNPDVVRGGGDNCTCATPAAPARSLPIGALLAALGAAVVLTLRRRR